MLDLGVEMFFHGANSGGGLAEVGNKRSSTGRCEFPCLTSGRTFGLILVIGVVIGMVAGSLGTLLTANSLSKVSENCLQSSKSFWGGVASLGAQWVPEAWFDPARTTISLLTAAVVVTEFLWSKSTVQISKDISPRCQFLRHLSLRAWMVRPDTVGGKLWKPIAGNDWWFFNSSVVCRSFFVPKLPHF